LNHAKGYDLYKDALIKILDKYPDWIGLSIGDESRRKIYIKHKQHKELGFLNHQKTLDILDKSRYSCGSIKMGRAFWKSCYGS
jgi:hypothetical protein